MAKDSWKNVYDSINSTPKWRIAQTAGINKINKIPWYNQVEVE